MIEFLFGFLAITIKLSVCHVMSVMTIERKLWSFLTSTNSNTQTHSFILAP
jgi:hypothetical protein